MFETVGTNFNKKIAYYYSPYKATSYISANEYCQLINGTLANPESSADLQILLNIIKNKLAKTTPPMFPYFDWLFGIIYNGKTRKFFSMSSGNDLNYSFTYSFRDPKLPLNATQCLTAGPPYVNNAYDITKIVLNVYICPMYSIPFRYFCEKKL